MVDTAILSIMSSKFTPAPMQFGFQDGIAVTQALLQAEDNAKKGMHHAGALDLEKAYDKVERHKLLEVMKQWVDNENISMLRGMLGPKRIKARRDPSDYIDTLTSGVPQWAPSSEDGAPCGTNEHIEQYRGVPDTV